MFKPDCNKSPGHLQRHLQMKITAVQRLWLSISLGSTLDGCFSSEKHIYIVCNSRFMMMMLSLQIQDRYRVKLFEVRWPQTENI